MYRGAYDEAYVTALGPSDGCVNACKDYRGADRCGGQYAISLYRLTGVAYDTGAGACCLLIMTHAVNPVHSFPAHCSPMGLHATLWIPVDSVMKHCSM